MDCPSCGHSWAVHWRTGCQFCGCKKQPTAIDCTSGHPEAKSSEFAFRLRTKPIGVLKFEGEAPLMLGNCHHCASTLAFEVTDDMQSRAT